MSFDNTTEPAAKLRAALDRAEKAEGIAADLAAELQEARIALADLVCLIEWQKIEPYPVYINTLRNARKILDRVKDKEQH